MQTTPSARFLSASRPGSVRTAALGLVLVAGVAAGVWWFGVRPDGDGAGAAKVVKTSDIARAQVASFEVTTTATGELQALEQIEVRSTLENQAAIVQIIDEGTIVKKGDVLCVMNTDNLSILGLTLDYGPYGWIDDYDPEWTPNTTDRHHGRYRFGQQPRIAHWNLACLAHALSPLFAVAEPLQAGLVRYAESYAACERADIAAKLGLAQLRDDDGPLVADLHAWLRTAEVDMTLFFRNLADLDPARPDPQLFEAAFYDESRRAAHAATFDDWLARYAARLGDDPQAPDARRAAMRQVNPRYVLRNYLAQQAIDRAEQGDESMIHELLDLLRRPYDDQPERDHYAARRPDWARTRAGCSMLSCSS